MSKSKVQNLIQSFAKEGISDEELLNEGKQLQFQLPLEVFPKDIQLIIHQTNECIGYPTDYVAASMLYAASVAIGNAFHVEIMKGYQQNAVLYLAIVGRPGINKTQPLKFAIKPIEKCDKENFRRYKEEKAEYDRIKNLDKSERQEQGVELPESPPFWKQYLLTDYTLESLNAVHQNNPKGIGIYADELTGWFEKFDRYNKGGEEQFWLSVWSGAAVRVNRKVEEPKFIDNPFISVAGTIQPKLLHTLLNNQKKDNGFIDRLLFVYPDYLSKPYWSTKELEGSVFQRWNDIIERLLVLVFDVEEGNTVLHFTPEAKERLFEWQHEITDISNEPNNEELCGIYAKIEPYALRLSLLLELLDYACGNSDASQVSLKSVEGAIQLAEYFKESALKVRNIVHDATPLDDLDSSKQRLYNDLPEKFSTKDGVKKAIQHGVKERSFKTLLTNEKLFEKEKRGVYLKLL